MRSAAFFGSVCALALLGTFPTAAQVAPGTSGSSRATAEVLVLGVYHMANPGRDIANIRADDVLASKRQQEIAELVEVLKRFKPTKIAVEAATNSRTVPQRFADYVAGRYELTRNEVDQIGFRLAKALGHPKIYPVDADGEFPEPRVVGYAKAHDEAAEYQGMMDDLQTWVKAEDTYLASHTVLETLLYMNSDAQIATSVGFYFREAHYGEPWDWAGADLVSDWFRRNARIFSNIVDLVDSPQERILVIYGAGHLGWLQFMLQSDPSVRLRKLGEFVR